MKRYILFFVGCLMSLYVVAETEATAVCDAPRFWTSDISYRSAKINWGEQSSHISFEICYETSEYWDSYYTSVGPLFGKSSYTIDNLKPNTQYKVCVRAKCSNNEWSACNPITFRTLSTPVCKTPSNVQVREITGYNAKVTWTPGETGQDRWEVQYYENVGGVTPSLKNLMVGDSPEVVIDGLSKNTRYAVSVRAICTDDITGDEFYSNYSLETNFTTTNQDRPNLTPQVEHNVSRESDPYTCKAQSAVALSSTFDYYMDRVYFYEVDRNGQLTKIHEGGDGATYNVTPYVGKHTYVVAATKAKINAPAHRSPASVENLPDSQLPLFEEKDMLQYDIYYVNVKYHVENHEVTLSADLITDKANYNLWTSAGTVNPVNNKTFCGMDFYYSAVQGTTETLTILKQTNDDAANISIPVELSVSANKYIYRVYIANRFKEIQWCDEFRIKVNKANCDTGLVYRKWDDFMFVDNGKNGGKGTFVAYQWYKDGHIISNATKQWIRTTLPEYEQKLPSGRYYVLITDDQGNSFYTCPTEFINLPQSAVEDPHKSTGAAVKRLRNGQLLIEYNGKSYNAQGQLIENGNH